MNKDIRINQFKSNPKLDLLISDLRKLLKPLQKNILFPNAKVLPVGGIIGSPRSGTTLLLQILSSSGLFAYPTNFLARFAYSPYIGALIQQMIFNKDYDYNNNFEDLNSSFSFSSSLGNTTGALAPNEFMHFFRCYMPNHCPRYIDQSESSNIDYLSICKDLISITKVFNKPFVTKTTMLQYNIVESNKHIDFLYWIRIKRNPIAVMKSILKARKTHYGRYDIWWSVKPKEYEFLKDMDVFHQIAGQVYFTEKSLDEELRLIASDRQMTIEYKDLCLHPIETVKNIQKLFPCLNNSNPMNLPESFDFKDDDIDLTENDKKLLEAYKSFSNNNVIL